MRYPKSNGYRNKYGNSRYEQKQINSYDRSLKKKDKFYRSSNSDRVIKVSAGSIFSIILILLIIVSLSQFLRTGTSGDMGFSGFINFLSNAPSFDITWSIVDLTIYSDWGVFDFLRNFINWFTSIFEVLVFIFGMLVETLEYLFYFIRGLLFP